MRGRFKYIGESRLILLIAVVLGVGSAAAIYLDARAWGRIVNGLWETSLETGSTSAGIYSRTPLA
jgi:hypothetical protein